MTTIKITTEMLHAADACSDGIAEFEAAYPAGLDVEWTRETQIALIRDCPVAREYFGWAVSSGLIPAWSMSYSNMSGADLRLADLRGADLRLADLRGADLRTANLCGADLTGANLTGADMRCADMRGHDLDDLRRRGAIID